MDILPAAPDDAGDILTVQKAAFQRQAEIYDDHGLPPLVETADDIRNAFGEWVILKAVEQGRLVGSARGRLDEDGSCCVARVSVHPDFQGRGYGKALMAALEAACPHVTRFELFTGKKSLRNIAFYEKLGYHVYAQDDRGHIRIVRMEKVVE